jgi:thiamine-phosphate pyrophosphorylase
MPERILLCYITDRAALGADERSRRLRLLEKIGEAARHGVDYIQLRERDLCGRELAALAGEAMRVIRDASLGGRPRTALLINSRTDVALAAGADGVHLRGDDVPVQDVKAAWTQAASGCSVRTEPIVSVSCHSAEEVEHAAAEGAGVAVFAPVFEKQNATPAGIEGLRRACRAKIPVFALGGVTLENAGACLRAGAAGIAGIRLFQEGEISAVVRSVRGE